MFARSTTIHAVKSHVDEGLALVRSEVLPALQAMDGFVGLSMMIDRATGLTITTSAWSDAPAMSGSTAITRPLRAKVADAMEGDGTVDEWEIVAMHRDHPTDEGACARATWLEFDPLRAPDLIETYRISVLPSMEMLRGFCSASFMMDRDRGRAVSTCSFTSREDMMATRDRGNEIRTAAGAQTSAEVTMVHEFDLAVAHLRVPELV